MRLSKIFLSILFCLALAGSVFGRGDYYKGAQTVAVAGCSYDYCEDFESTGIEANWVDDEEAAGTYVVDWDETVLGINGQSLELNTAEGDSNYVVAKYNKASAYADTMYAFFKIKFTTLGATVVPKTFFHVAENDTSSIGQFKLDVNSSNKWECVHGTVTHDAATAPTAGTVYYVWIKVSEKTDGDNGIAQMWVSENGTKPETPTCSVTTGDDTNVNPQDVKFQSYDGQDIIADDLIIDDEAIGNQ